MYESNYKHLMNYYILIFFAPADFELTSITQERVLNTDIPQVSVTFTWKNNGPEKGNACILFTPPKGMLVICYNYDYNMKY